MEPAAPGTEEDVLLVPSSFNKKETEEIRLLSIKAKLPNGSYGNVFEHSIVNGSEFWYCNLCLCPIMGRMYHHEAGKRHSSNMEGAGVVKEPREIDPNVDPEPPLHIAPGEPIPPGFEDTQKIAEIQVRLDAFKVDAIIGLEYLFELISDIDKEPAYICILCDKRGDPRTVLSHLASYNHISQYLQRHFLKCYRALAPYMTKQYKRNWQITMQKIAEAIETKYGRLKPHVVEKDVFEKKRVAYQTMVVKGPHFVERIGATFEELVVKEDLTKVIEDDAIAVVVQTEELKRKYRKSKGEFIENEKRSPSPPIVAKPKKPKAAASATNEKRRSLSSVSSISSSDLSDFDAGQSSLQKKGNKPKEELDTKKETYQKPRYSPPPRDGKRFEARGRFRASPFGRNRTDRNDKGRVLPWKRPDYRSRVENPVPERAKAKVDKHSEYKKLATAIERDMDRVLKQHEKNPEKHPQYNDEWKKFWNQRYKELQAEGKNPAGHDFKPEWIECWNKRLKELHANEVKTKKEALRKRLGVNEEPAQICFRITGKKKPNQKDDDSKLAPMASAPDQDPDIIVIDEKDSSDEKPIKRTNSPWEHESSRAVKKSRESPKRFRESPKRFRESPKRSRDSRSDSRERYRSRNINRRRSRSRSRDRYRRSRSRERVREVDWPVHDAYHEYPHEAMFYRGDYPEYIKPPRVMRDVTRHPVNSPPMMVPALPEPDPEPEDDGEVNVVSVLRLLTALEEKLGSLGPKIIDLLSQALSMEKTEANSSETLLDNDVNCVMFETVKEKLKGQMLAGLVNLPQEKAFKIAIKKIAGLIYLASERKREKERIKPKVDPIQVPGVGKVDKGAIAKQIAAALIVQGKTDVTQNELEQLINAVVGMAEASQASNKRVTTASFLQQLTAEKASAAPVAETPTVITISDSPKASTNSMEGLSDSDLQTLLQNFKDLCTDEQHSLISYLKKLEAREPERVERLRKFVNLEATSSALPEKDTDQLFEKSDEEANGRGTSPFASRFAGTNPSKDDTTKHQVQQGNKKRNIDKVVIDSDEEDYTFEDVFKAANKNLRDKEEKEEQERLAKEATVFKDEDFDLTNAKSIIANIMDQFKGRTEAASTSVLNPAPTITNTTPSTTNSTPSISNPITNLAPSILNPAPTIYSSNVNPTPPIIKMTLPVVNPAPPVVVPPPKPPNVPLPAFFSNPNILENIPLNVANITNALQTAHQAKLQQPQSQPPVLAKTDAGINNMPSINNPNSLPFQQRSQMQNSNVNMNNRNPNPNNFSLQGRSQHVQQFPPRNQMPHQQLPVANQMPQHHLNQMPQNQQFARTPHFEPPLHLQQFPPRNQNQMQQQQFAPRGPNFEPPRQNMQFRQRQMDYFNDDY